MIGLLVTAFPALSRAAPEESSAGALDEIVVTANKRDEPLQKTPAAVTALTGGSLVDAGITDIRGAQDFVPSVRFQQENAATEIYIRGVGSTLDFPQVASPNVFNLNGISVPREASSAPLYDVAQLEVLPGPQGTLYGSSAMGGAVNVNFRRPTQAFDVRTLFEAGNDGLIHVSAAGNVPITTTLAVRAAVDYLHHDGYQTSGADSQSDLAGRLSLLYRPTDDFTLYLWGSSVSKDGHPPNLVPRGIDPVTGAFAPNRYLNANPWNDQFPAPYAAILPYGQPKAESQDYSNTMLGGQLDLRVAGDIVVTWIPSYLSVNTSPQYWLGAFPGNESDDYRQVTNELRATATAPWGTWLAGLYAYDLDSHGTFTFGSFTPGKGFPVSIVDASRISGEAVFGQATVDLAARVRGTVGGRYSWDERTGDGQFFDGAGLSPYTYGHHFSHADYKAGVDYDLTPRVMLYAASQTGYQPGTFNAYASTPAVSNAVNQATLTAYTVGFKSRTRDERLQINDEIFYYDYRGLFAAAYNTVLNSNQTFNAQKTEIFGDQLDVLFKPAADDQFNLSVGYLHARNMRFDLPDGTRNFDGYQLQYAPDWTFSGGYSHDIHWETGYVRAHVNSRYEDAFYADFSHTPGGRQKPYFKSDASLTYFPASGGWSVGAWVRNIENVAVIAATAGGSNIPPLSTGATAFLEAPRTFGVRATWEF